MCDVALSEFIRPASQPHEWLALQKRANWVDGTRKSQYHQVNFTSIVHTKPEKRVSPLLRVRILHFDSDLNLVFEYFPHIIRIDPLPLTTPVSRP